MLNFFRKRASMIKIVFGVVLFFTCVSMVVTLIAGITGDTTDQGPIETAADEYEDAFNRAVLKRFRRFALEIEDR